MLVTFLGKLGPSSLEGLVGLEPGNKISKKRWAVSKSREGLVLCLSEEAETPPMPLGALSPSLAGLSLPLKFAKSGSTSGSP